jgi:glyoxylase-like metal-dependent hydrolase (beta-lactamase superfamily II)
MAPTQMFERSIVLNGTSGRQVELLHPGLGDTRGDAVAWLPKERILFTGDLVTNGPFNIVRDSEMAPWIDTLSTLQTLNPLVVCPGHGARSDISLIVQQREFFVALRKEVVLPQAGRGLSRDGHQRSRRRDPTPGRPICALPARPSRTDVRSAPHVTGGRKPLPNLPKLPSAAIQVGPENYQS